MESRRGAASGGAETEGASSSNFWKTTGLATILAALIALFGTILQHIWPEQHASSAPSTGATSVTSTPAAAVGPVGTPAEAPGSSKIRWKGTYHLSTFVDFDAVPPNPKEPDLFIQDQSDGDLYTSGRAAIWSGATPPSESQCHDAVSTDAKGIISLAKGVQLCFETGQGREVYFEVRAVHRSTENRTDFELAATVWEIQQ